MDILKHPLKWARPLTPLDISKVTAIALHHMEHLTAGIDEVHQWHLDRDFKGFAYNYWVDYEGGVWEGRGLNAGGGLYDPLNDTIISIGFQGDYDITEEIPAKQFVSGCEIIKYLRDTIPSIKMVEGHKYWEPKSCPGTYFPLAEMKAMADRIQSIKDYDDISDWAKPALLNVLNSGIMLGDDQGYFKPKSPMTRQEAAVVIDRMFDIFH